jgi:hypothetical protein
MKEHRVVRLRTGCAPEVCVTYVTTKWPHSDDIIAEWTGLYDIGNTPIADGNITNVGEVHYVDGAWYAGAVRLCAEYVECRKIRVIGHILKKQKLEFNKYYKGNEGVKIHILANIAPDMSKVTQICEMQDGTITVVPQGHIWKEITKEDFNE